MLQKVELENQMGTFIYFLEEKLFEAFLCFYAVDFTQLFLYKHFRMSGYSLINFKEYRQMLQNYIKTSSFLFKLMVETNKVDKS